MCCSVLLMKSATTSLRIPTTLRARLERHAKRTKTPRNRVLLTALERYLEEEGEAGRALEARRQSLLASGESAGSGWETGEGDAWPTK